MSLKIVLGVLSVALCVNASKLLDLGPYSVDTKIDKNGKYNPLDKLDLEATAAVDKFLKLSVNNDTLNPYLVSKLPDLALLAFGPAKLSNLKVVGVKSVKLDDVEMRMNFGVKPKTNPFRLDLKLNLPLLTLGLDVETDLGDGNLKVNLVGVKAEVAVKATITPKTKKVDDSVFQLYYLGVKGSVDNLQLQLNLGLPDSIENDVPLIKNVLDMTKDTIVQYAVKNALRKVNDELRKLSADDVLNILVPDRQKLLSI